MRSVISLSLFGLAALGLAALPGSALSGGDKGVSAEKGKVAGILIRRDNRTLLVRADGEEKPTKYLLPERPDARLAAALKGLFTVQRVHITYRLDGDTRHVTSLVRVPGKASGTVTGKVIAVHDNFWLEVKPSKGPLEGFAAGLPDKSREVLATLKTLRKVDTVTIRYYTDFERHRIISIRKVEKR